MINKDNSFLSNENNDKNIIKEKKKIEDNQKNNINNVNNIIIAHIKVQKDNSKKRLINSYENAKREEPELDLDNKETFGNEIQIKNCEIFINNKKIEFNYFYIFEKEGNYIIKYIFKGQ